MISLNMKFPYKITAYEYKKVKIEDYTLELPSETVCIQKNVGGLESYIRIIPVHTTWLHDEGKPEEVYKFHVTSVRIRALFKVEIQHHSVPLRAFEMVFNSKTITTDEELAIKDVIDYQDHYTISEEQFNKYLTHAIKLLNDVEY